MFGLRNAFRTLAFIDLRFLCSRSFELIGNRISANPLQSNRERSLISGRDVFLASGRPVILLSGIRPQLARGPESGGPTKTSLCQATMRRTAIKPKQPALPGALKCTQAPLFQNSRSTFQ